MDLLLNVVPFDDETGCIDGNAAIEKARLKADKSAVALYASSYLGMNPDRVVVGAT
jgi:hypothetical protein